MAHPIRQISSVQVQNDFLQQPDLGRASETSNREGYIDQQLATLTKRVATVSVDLQQIDNKWSRQFSGFQETASITAEAVIGFENELEKHKSCLEQLGTLLSKNMGSVNTRSNLSGPALENFIQEFAAYRSNVQATLTRLYAGLGVLVLGFIASVAFIATKL